MRIRRLLLNGGSGLADGTGEEVGEVRLAGAVLAASAYDRVVGERVAGEAP